MSQRALADLGRQMRMAQKRYFATKERGELELAKKLEAQFDRACAEVLAGPEDDLPGRQQNLFDNIDPS